MQRFSHRGFDLAFLDEGAGEAVLLIHGFASSMMINWVATGWVRTLADAGYRVVAFDNRGHGQSTRSYEPADYTPQEMASDAAALLGQLGIGRAHVMGYSMGARIAAFMALEYPDQVATLVLGGLGSGLIEGVGDWDPIAEALLADDAASVTHPRGRTFRTFADQTRSDRRALAACIATSRVELSPGEVARITQPTLVAVGSRDDVGGSAEQLAALLPGGEAFDIVGRDHMLAVGDRTFKARAVAFLVQHPISPPV